MIRAASLALLLAVSASADNFPPICTSLDSAGVSWPGDLTSSDRQAVLLALSVTGSFEGPDSWANITGNFDGQGLSLGLLSQCLGQGSLQPLLLRLSVEHPDVLSRLSPAHRQSLLTMLEAWKTEAAEESQPARLSLLDESEEPALAADASADARSAAWARANLYDGAHFDPAWKAELQALAASPEYVSLQIDAALRAHGKAAAYEALIGVRELRAYLMLFDVVVQNGGFYARDLSDYADYAKTAPAATDTEKLEKLLELRLRRVRPEYAADVRARKLAIVDGTGAVHGEARDLPAQYCYEGGRPYR